MRLLSERKYQLALRRSVEEYRGAVVELLLAFADRLPKTATTKRNLLRDILMQIDPSKQMPELHPRRRAKRKAAVVND
jgi:hypothetical protein